MARIASARPVAIAIGLVTIAPLLARRQRTCASMELGITYISGLPDDSEAKRAADAAREGFAPGILAPTEVDLVAPGIADGGRSSPGSRTLVGRRAGGRDRVGPREQPPAPAPP